MINGRKAFITGADGAKVGIVMAKAEQGATACSWSTCPIPRIRIERVLDTIDSSMPGGHAVVAIDNLRVPADQMLGEAGEGFKYAQVRLAPGAAVALHALAAALHPRAEIATDYAIRRQAFGKPLIDHEGVGFMLADNLIDLKQAELMIDWCAGVLDTGALGTVESSMAKVAVSEALYPRRRPLRPGDGRHRRHRRHHRRADVPRNPRLPHLRRPDRGPQMVARQEDQARRREGAT